MARELAIDVVLNSQDAQYELNKLYTAFRAAGDSALEASNKVERFEKAYRENSGKAEARKALDALKKSNEGVADATRRTGEAMDDAKGKIGAKTAAVDMLRNAVIRYAAPAAIGTAILKTIDWADSVQEAAQRASITTTQVQQLTKMAEKNGSSFGAMAGLIQASEQRLAGHNKQAEAAVRLLGMAPERLMKLDPLERLRAIAQGLANIKDPAQRSSLEVDILGKRADEATAALNELAKGSDKLETALGQDFVTAGAAAQDVLDDMKNKALDFLKTIVLVVPTLLVQARRLDEARKAQGLGPGTPNSYLGYMGYGSPLDGIIGAQIAKDYAPPGMPNGSGYTDANGRFVQTPLWAPGMPTPLGAPASPWAPGAFGGNSLSFVENSLRLVKGNRTGGKTINPYVVGALGMGSQILGPMGTGGLGEFPGWAIPDPLTSSMTASQMGIGFDHNSQMVPFAGTVPMYPGGQAGGVGNWLKNNKAKVGVAAGSMLAGYLGNKIGGKAGGALSGAAQGAQMGMMFGPWGAAVGGVIGGVAGWIGAGKAAKNKKNQEISDVYAQFSTDEFIKLQKEAERLGVSLDKSLKAKTMKDFAAATEEAAKKVKELTDMEDEIKRLTEAATVDFDKMNSIVQEFGLDVSKLGPAFQQAKIDKEAQRIIDAMAIMEKGGADMNGVLEGMADEISTLVQDSIKFGTTIPENMKPWIESLMKSGKLVDENGQQITDMSKIKFGAAMESEMSKVVKKLDELIAKLAEMTAGLRTATGAATDLAGVDYNGPNWGEGPPNPGSNTDNGFATGGVVGRDFRRPGNGDVFAALLKRGERVLPPGAAAGGVTINGLTVGEFGSRSAAVDEIGEAVVRYIERRGGRLVA